MTLAGRFGEGVQHPKIINLVLFHLENAHVGLGLASCFGEEVVVTEQFLPVEGCQFEIVDVLEGYLNEDEGDDYLQHRLIVYVAFVLLLFREYIVPSQVFCRCQPQRLVVLHNH